jgi:hypothetical protein
VARSAEMGRSHGSTDARHWCDMRSRLLHLQRWRLGVQPHPYALVKRCGPGEAELVRTTPWPGRARSQASHST